MTVTIGRYGFNPATGEIELYVPPNVHAGTPGHNVTYGPPVVLNANQDVPGGVGTIWQITAGNLEAVAPGATVVQVTIE